MLIVYFWHQDHWSLACTGLGGYSFHFTFNQGPIHPDRPRSSLQPVVDTGFKFAVESRRGESERGGSPIVCRIGIPSIQDGNWSGADEAAVYNWLLHGMHRDAEWRPTGPFNLFAKIPAALVNLGGRAARAVSGVRNVPINYSWSGIPGMPGEHCYEMVLKCLKAAFHHSESSLRMLYKGGIFGFNFLDLMSRKENSIAAQTLRDLVHRTTLRNHEMIGCQVIGRVNEMPFFKECTVARNIAVHTAAGEPVVFLPSSASGPFATRDNFYNLWKNHVWDARTNQYTQLPNYYLLAECRARVVAKVREFFIRCKLNSEPGKHRSLRKLPVVSLETPMPAHVRTAHQSYWHYFDPLQAVCAAGIQGIHCDFTRVTPEEAGLYAKTPADLLGLYHHLQRINDEDRVLKRGFYFEMTTEMVPTSTPPPAESEVYRTASRLPPPPGASSSAADAPFAFSAEPAFTLQMSGHICIPTVTIPSHRWRKEIDILREASLLVQVTPHTFSRVPNDNTRIEEVFVLKAGSKKNIFDAIMSIAQADPIQRTQNWVALEVTLDRAIRQLNAAMGAFERDIKDQKIRLAQGRQAFGDVFCPYPLHKTLLPVDVLPPFLQDKIYFRANRPR